MNASWPDGDKVPRPPLLITGSQVQPFAIASGEPGVCSGSLKCPIATLKIAGVPYRGDPAVATDLLDGRLDVASIVQGTASANRERIRLLGIFAEERHSAFPDTPTVKEQGFDVSPTSFGGIMAPAGTPEPVLAKLEQACAAAANDETYRTVAKGGGQPDNYHADRKTFASRLQRDIAVKKAALPGLPGSSP
jgi:tripartite-type tricarboxylate transporter receptor subunit TctC